MRRVDLLERLGNHGSDIGDVRWSGRYLWVGTESGLARLELDRASGLDGGDWVTFTEANGLGLGAVSALAASGDTVWAATIVDTPIASKRRITTRFFIPRL